MNQERQVPVPGKRRRGRQKNKWTDLGNRDMECLGLKVEDVMDRSGREKSKTIPVATPDDGKSPRKRRRRSERLSW